MKVLAEEKRCFLGKPRKTSGLLWGKKAQALVELAVFASIFLMVLSLLVRYGLSYNYSQHTQMSAFRRALGWTCDKELQGVSLTLTEARRMPTTQGPFGISSRQSFSAASAATWSSNLNMSREYEAAKIPFSELPTKMYIVDGKHLELTTADGYCNLDNNATISVKVDNPAGPVYWRWVTIGPNLSDLVDEDEGGIPYDLDGDGQKEVISSADVDGDGKEESLFYQFDEEGNFLKFYYLDYETGEIEITQDSRDVGDKQEQGFYDTHLGPDNLVTGIKYGDYKKLKTEPQGTTFQRMENLTEYKTVTKFDVEDTMYHTFKTNPNRTIPEEYRAFKTSEYGNESIIGFDSKIKRKETQAWQTSPPR